MKELNSLILSSQKIKYFGLNLMKEGQDLSSENYKMLEEIKDLNKRENIHVYKLEQYQDNLMGERIVL